MWPTGGLEQNWPCLPGLPFSNRKLKSHRGALTSGNTSSSRAWDVVRIAWLVHKMIGKESKDDKLRIFVIGIAQLCIVKLSVQNHEFGSEALWFRRVNNLAHLCTLYIVCTRPQWLEFRIVTVKAETRMNCLAIHGRCSSWVGSGVVKNEYVTPRLWAKERKLWRNKNLDRMHC